jgi:hypothetical protein
MSSRRRAGFPYRRSAPSSTSPCRVCGRSSRVLPRTPGMPRPKNGGRMIDGSPRGPRDGHRARSPPELGGDDEVMSPPGGEVRSRTPYCLCNSVGLDDHRRERLTLDVWKRPLKERRPECPDGCSLRCGCSWHFSSPSPHSTRGRIVAMLVGMEAHTRSPADTLPRCERMVSADRTLE